MSRKHGPPGNAEIGPYKAGFIRRGWKRLVQELQMSSMADRTYAYDLHFVCCVVLGRATPASKPDIHIESQGGVHQLRRGRLHAPSLPTPCPARLRHPICRGWDTEGTPGVLGFGFNPLGRGLVAWVHCPPVPVRLEPGRLQAQEEGHILVPVLRVCVGRVLAHRSLLDIQIVHRRCRHVVDHQVRVRFQLRILHLLHVEHKAVANARLGCPGGAAQPLAQQPPRGLAKQHRRLALLDHVLSSLRHHRVHQRGRLRPWPPLLQEWQLLQPALGHPRAPGLRLLIPREPARPGQAPATRFRGRQAVVGALQQEHQLPGTRHAVIRTGFATPPDLGHLCDQGLQVRWAKSAARR
mmetsp:Transcript_95573/g.164826  ORF Transcript_95573/g.164826 Transcript_95573/m.164826 type:complete len:352 (-) Transcript_95573:137-1192(-)